MIRYSLFLFTTLVLFPMSMVVFGVVPVGGDWRKADHSSAHIAPDPKQTKEAVIQVYSARLWSWRGAFGVHTWIATKRKEAPEYKVYQVIGWLYYIGKKPLNVETGIPDRKWFGQRPTVLVDLRGPKAEKVIESIEQAVSTYPAANRYRTWPGPNSNTFTAYVGRKVPELRLELPPHAIGKDYLVGDSILSRFFAKTPSGTGWQFSFFGLLGVGVGVEEGLEFNFMGLNFGVDPRDVALLLPGWGKVSFKH